MNNYKYTTFSGKKQIISIWIVDERIYDVGPDGETNSINIA